MARTYAAAGSSVGVSSSSAELDLELPDPRAVDLEHAEAEAVRAHLVADLRRTSELAEHEPGHRVEVLLLERRVELLVEVVDRVRAVDANVRVVDALDRRVGQVELVLDVADDLLEQVLERDDPLHVAVLVDDDREVLLLAAEVGEEGREVLRLRDDVGRPDDRLELDGRDPEIVDRAEEVADVEDPDDVVERAAVDRVAREGRVDDGPKRFLGRHVRGDPDHLGPRDHHRRDLLRGEVEDLVQHLLLGLFELPVILGRRDRVPDVLTGVRDHPGRRGLDAEKPEDGIRRHLQEPDDRMRDSPEEVERHREHHRERLGLLQRDRLRHQLAEHDGQVREERERDQERNRVRERRLHEVRDERLADGTDEDREDGDAELRARDEADRLVHQSERRASSAVAVGRTLLESRPSRRDQRILGRDEHRAPQDEEQHHDDSKWNAHAPSRPSAKAARIACSNGNAPRGAQVLGG